MPGWGYPSNGLSNITVVCQGDQTWNITEVEDCVCKSSNCSISTLNASWRKCFYIFIFQLSLVECNFLLNFSVLPCPKTPPDPPNGGWSWYGIAETTYKCPNGHAFLDGSYPNSTAKCNLLKQWEPAEQMECQGKNTIHIMILVL